MLFGLIDIAHDWYLWDLHSTRTSSSISFKGGWWSGIWSGVKCLNPRRMSIMSDKPQHSTCHTPQAFNQLWMINSCLDNGLPKLQNHLGKIPWPTQDYHFPVCIECHANRSSPASTVNSTVSEVIFVAPNICPSRHLSPRRFTCLCKLIKQIRDMWLTLICVAWCATNVVHDLWFRMMVVLHCIWS